MYKFDLGKGLIVRAPFNGGRLDLLKDATASEIIDCDADGTPCISTGKYELGMSAETYSHDITSSYKFGKNLGILLGSLLTAGGVALITTGSRLLKNFSKKKTKKSEKQTINQEEISELEP